MALVENMIDGSAYRNSDIIKTYKGLTVEIFNTDAEGRNILADALSYT
jgi:leucyl aminopeptidase